MPSNSHNFVKKKLVAEAEKPAEKKPLIEVKPVRKVKKPIPDESTAGSYVETAAEKEKIKKQLHEIYKNDDGSMPDMADFRKNKRSRLINAFFFLLFSCLVLGAVAWVGFFVLQPSNDSATTDVALTISGDAEITSGQNVTYRIRYRNEQSVPLSKVLLQVRYPAGFVFGSSTIDPTNEANNEWRLDSLNSHGSGILEIHGQMFGNFGDKQPLQAFLNYYSANFSSEFQKVASFDIIVNKGIAELQVQAPAEIAPGTKTDLVITIKKLGTEPLKNLALVLDAGKNFTMSSSSLATDPDNNLRWTIAELNNDLQINISGTYVQAAGLTNASLKFSLLGWKDINTKATPYILAETIAETDFSKPAFGASLIINSSTEDGILSPGQVLQTNIVLDNTSGQALNDVEVSLIFDTPSYQNKSMLEWKKISDSNDGDISGVQLSPDLRRGIIVWNVKKISVLKQIAVGKGLSINLSIPIRDKDSVDLSSFKDSIITATVEIKYKIAGEQKLLSTNGLKLVVNSDLHLESRDSASTDGGSKEVHTLNWILTNSFHELKDIEVGADVYGDVSWLADKLSVPAGEAKFDSQAKKIVWKVSTMPLQVDTLALQFGLQLNSKNPSQTNLTSNINLKATDVATGQTITQSLPGVLLK